MNERPAIRTSLAFLIFVITTVLIYWPAVHGSFFFDDWAYLVENSDLTAAANPWRFWTHLTQADYYWPLSYSVFWALWKLFAINTFPYHLLSLALHATNATLLYTVLRRYGLRHAWIGAALFLVHPVNVEAVAWIFQLKTLLATFFALLAWKFELGKKRGAALGSFALGLLCKSSIVVLPIFLELGERLLPASPERPRQGFRQHTPYYVMAGAFGIANLLVNRADLAGDLRTPVSFTWLDRLGIAGRAFWFDLGKLFWPHPLLTIYPRFELGATALLAGCGLVFGFAWLVWKRDRAWNRNVLPGLAFYFVGLLPTLGFLELPFFRHSFVADHWQYLALVGLAIAIARAERPRWVGAISALAVPLAIVSWNQAHYYESEETMWKHVAEYNSESSFVWYSQGVNYERRHELASAEQAYRNALERDPHDLLALFNLGSVSLKENRPAEAERNFSRFIELQPDYPPAYQALKASQEAARKTERVFK